MKLNKGERYELTKPLVVRTSFSIGTLPIGTEIEIQQVNKDYRQYLVENTWMHYSVVESAIQEEETK